MPHYNISLFFKAKRTQTEIVREKRGRVERQKKTGKNNGVNNPAEERIVRDWRKNESAELSAKSAKQAASGGTAYVSGPGVCTRGAEITHYDSFALVSVTRACIYIERERESARLQSV